MSSASNPAAPADAAAAIEPLALELEKRLGRPVRRIETHISWVLLDGVHAWKIKKPVRLGFLDFTSLQTRRHFCEEELRLNRRLAADLYLDVVAIRGTRDAPSLDAAAGPPIDYAVRMRQFPEGALFSERLAAGALQPVQVDLFARRLAAFERDAARAGPDTDYGSPDRVLAETSDVIDGICESGGASWIAPLRERVLEEARRLRAVFAERKAGGWIREGHGDLHLANVVVLGDEVTAFDCIEFDPGLRWIDVQSDAAFLVMDLLAHARGDLAFRFLDAWLAESGDYEGLAVLPHYLVHRALVRALVAGIRAQQGARAQGPDYAALAGRLSSARDPRLMITHGLSGSGKSHVSQRVLELACAVRLRSDVERKRLAGMHALGSSHSGLDEGLYAASASARTYERLLGLAGIALDAGFPTIVDAAFLRAGDRERFRALARARNVPFTILHCRAATALLRERLRERASTGRDASEADAAVLEHQLAHHDALSEDELRSTIDVDTVQPLDARSIAGRWKAWR